MNILDILERHAWWLDGEETERADFRSVNLQSADLRDADLRDADLRDADLRGADLEGADLRGAKLPPCSEILKAKWLDHLKHIKDDEQRAKSLLERYCTV